MTATLDTTTPFKGKFARNQGEDTGATQRCCSWASTWAPRAARSFQESVREKHVTVTSAGRKMQSVSST